MINDDNSDMRLKVEDTVVVNKNEEGIYIVSFIESIYDDDKNTQQAQAGVDKCFELVSKEQETGPVNFIVDLRPMGNKSHISPKARDVYKKFITDPKVGKVAVLGSSDAQVSIANFVLSFTGDSEQKLSWFTNEAEAKYWLKS